MEHYWLVRETDVEYLRPLRYGDSIQVKTWVSDFRRVRSRRAYELWLIEPAELVARASTDWVFLSRNTGRPATIPSEMVNAFYPEGLPEQAPPRSRFPIAPPPPPGVFQRRQQIKWQDIDSAQHVNNAVYLAYMEDCGVQATTVHGWPRSRMRTEGFDIVARQHRIEYRQPAVLGDEVEITTWVSDVERDTAIRHYAITRASDGVLLVQARMVWGTVDAKIQQPIRMPAKFLRDLALNIGQSTR
jgi:acyl-CoA thioester hydrolase